MFERIDYIVKQIDGDYAYLERLEKPEGQEDELKCASAGNYGRQSSGV